MSSEKRNSIKEVHNKLVDVLRKRSLKATLQGLYVALIAACGFFFVLTIAEAAGNYESGVRTVLFFVFAGLVIGLIGYLLLYRLLKDFPLIKSPDYYGIAMDVGKHYPDVKDDLSNALQLMDEQEKNNYSPKLVEAAYDKVYARTKNIRFADVVKFNDTMKLMRAAIAVAVLSLLVIIVVPGLSGAANRIINYDKEFVTPPKFTFNVKPGNTNVTKGENVIVTVTANGDRPEAIYLLTKSEEESEYKEERLLPDSTGEFKHTINTVRASFAYYAQADDIRSGLYKVSVIDRPIVSAFDITVSPPSYSKLPRIVQKDNGNVTSLVGSRINLDLTASKELKNANIVLSDSTQIPVNINDNGGGVSFTVRKDDEYYISLTDTEGNTNENPVVYSIKALYDENPAIELLQPEGDVKLTKDDKITIIVKIEDDYGFSKLVLNHRLSSSVYDEAEEDFTGLEIPFERGKKEDEVFYLWDLAPRLLAVDDVVSYYIEVFDNDIVSGPKSARTGIYTVRVPSLDEMFAGAEKTQENAAEELTETLKEAEKLQKDLEKINNELKRDEQEISYDEKEKIEKAIEKFNELSKKVEDVQEKLQKMQREMQDNDLLSEETMQKYAELQELMDELTDESLKQAMKRMQEMMESLMRDKTQQAMQDMKLDEERFKKSLERTVNLLKRIQIEQKMDEIVKRTDELLGKQNELTENTEQSGEQNNEQTNDELSRKQDEVTEDIGKLEQELDKLQEKMSELEDMPEEQLEQLREEFEKQQNRQKSEQAKQQLQQNRKQDAMQQQQQISQNMQKMQEQMQGMQEQMQQEQQMQVFKDMLKIVDNLITISKEQEDVKEKTGKLMPMSEEMKDQTQRQSDLQRNLDKVIEQMSSLSQKTFAVTPEMGKAMGKARFEMSEAMSLMQARNNGHAERKQAQAMANVNEAATLMKNTMEQMMKGGGQGGGMMSLMQQLQQMSQQQMNLNQLTQQLQQGQLSQQQMAQLQRLAQEQEALRKSLDQLNKESKAGGESKKLSTSLDKVLEDMQEVVTNMKTERVDDDLVRTQERILSRLLDAQRSINERDYEKRRESETGRDIARDAPPELIFGTNEGKDKLRNELLKAVKEGYLKDYEDLIRAYYEALEKEGVNN